MENQKQKLPQASERDAKKPPKKQSEHVLLSCGGHSREREQLFTSLTGFPPEMYNIYRERSLHSTDSTTYEYAPI